MRLRIALAILLAFSSTAHAQEVPTPPEVMLDAANEAEFFASVAIGDRERAAGHVPEAAIAYARALHIRRDPVVAGRLGVLLVQAEKYGQAADLLDIALKHAKAPLAEREGYFRAYEEARKHGAWVDIIISEAGATIALDGQPRNQGGYSAFSIFVVAGEHRLTAILDGFYDATVPFTVRAGEDMKVAVNLRPLFQRIERPSPDRKAPPSAPSTNVVGDPNYDRNEDPFYEDPKLRKTKDAEEARPIRGSIFAGPVVVFGVASWMPAVGGVIGGSWRPNQYFSLGLEGRAAWLTTGVGGEPISAMTAGGLLSACGHVNWFFGCALGHVGVVRGQTSGATFLSESYSSLKIGVGGRVGLQKRLTRSFSLSGMVDAVALNSGIRVRLGDLVLVDQPPVMLGVQLFGGWDF